MTAEKKRPFPTKDFYCVSKAITKNIDIYASILFGYIWSMCGLANGYCNASYQTMANELGLNKKTIERKIALLLKYNLINDISGTKFNKPGVTRKYIVNESKLKDLEIDVKIDKAIFKEISKSNDSKSLPTNDSKSLLDNQNMLSNDSESISSDSKSKSNDFESQSNDSESVKIYREIDKEIDIKSDTGGKPPETNVVNTENNNKLSIDNYRLKIQEMLDLLSIADKNNLASKAKDLNINTRFLEGDFENLIKVYEFLKKNISNNQKSVLN